MPKLIVATVLMILSLGAVAFTSPLSWSGYDFREVNSFSEIPVGIQTKLGVGKQGIGGVAYFGQPLNFTEVVDCAKPMLWLLAAGRNGGTWLVALEQGGRGYSVQVYLFSADQQRQHWVLLSRPTSLHEVLQHISSASQVHGG